MATTVDKSWRAQGVDADLVIRDMEAYDVRVAASLKLMQVFQLRFKESVMLRPHSDVISAAQAGKPSDGVAHYLDTHRGTKDGRERMFPIDNAMRQKAKRPVCDVRANGRWPTISRRSPRRAS